MFLILLSLLFLFSTNSFYAREPQTISCTKEIIDNDPKNPIVEITTVQMVPDERPLFHLMPQYDQEVTTVLRYTGFDPNNLPEYSEQEIYITRESSSSNDQPSISKVVMPSEEDKKFAEDVERLFKKNNTVFKLDAKTIGYGLLAAGAVSVYGYILWKLYTLSKVVKIKGNWAHWKSEMPLEILYDMPIDEVKKSLRNSVNEYYKEITDVDGIAEPLLFFQEDIAFEITKLEKFIKFYRFLDRTLLSVFFPECYDKAYTLAKDQVDRLYYLQDIIEDEITAKYFSR
jgi:hypothetical protein